MKRWVLLILGVILALAGIVWTLQGLDLLGQTGGMNGQKIWSVIGPITAIIGVVLVVAGARSGKDGAPTT